MLKYNKIINKDKFYGTLNYSSISDNEYLQQYKMVWNKLKYKTLGNYSDLYNIQDVIFVTSYTITSPEVRR